MSVETSVGESAYPAYNGGLAGMPNFERPSIAMDEARKQAFVKLGGKALFLEMIGNETVARPDMYRIGDLYATDEPVPAGPTRGSHLLLPNSVEGHDITRNIMLQRLRREPPGSLKIIAYDPAEVAGTLSDFNRLTEAGLLENVDPGSHNLTRMLDELIGDAVRIREKILGARRRSDGSTYSSLDELVKDTGEELSEPFRMVALFCDEADMSAHQRDQLGRLVHVGAQVGIQLCLHGAYGQLATASGHPKIDAMTIETDPDQSNVIVYSDKLNGHPLVADLPPQPYEITAAVDSIVENAIKDPIAPRLNDFEPERYWTESAERGIVAPVGRTRDGALYSIRLGDEDGYSPHILIAGATRSGKDTFLRDYLLSLAMRYSPEELQLYLLDHKGVDFLQHAAEPNDPSYLPHAQAIGINLEDSHEFSVNTAKEVYKEYLRRKQAMQELGVTNYRGLRENDPAGRWPRIILAISEYEDLFNGPYAKEAVAILSELARKSASNGIHLLLSSQSVPNAAVARLGFDSNSLFNQLTLRVAMRQATGVLAPDNQAASKLQRRHVIVNTASGAAGFNATMQFPRSDREDVQPLQRIMCAQPNIGTYPEPYAYNGNYVPRLTEAKDIYNTPTISKDETPTVKLGGNIASGNSSVGTTLDRAPGRNIAIIGASRETEARDILGTALTSLVHQYAPGTAEFPVLCYDNRSLPYVRKLVASLRREGHRVSLFENGATDDIVRTSVALKTITKRLGNPAGDRRRVVFVIGGDASPELVNPASEQRKALRTILNNGPMLGTHVVGWWRTAASVAKFALPNVSANGLPEGAMTAIGDLFNAWVALDTQPNEMSTSGLSPVPGGHPFDPTRHRRATFYDRRRHTGAGSTSFIPYRTE